jgi:hypothetical protein
MEVNNGTLEWSLDQSRWSNQTFNTEQTEEVTASGRWDPVTALLFL